MKRWHTLACACVAQLALGGLAVHAADETTMPEATSDEQTAEARAMLSNPSDAEAQARYEEAREQFKAMAAGSEPELLPPVGEYEIAVFSDPDKQFHPGGESLNVALEDIRVVMDVEDVSLRDVINQIVGQAAEYTGPWTVKWRLKPENTRLPEERVNLTAESTFGSFINLLTERVRNMSGVQLFTTAYEDARVILVTDTYY